MPPVEAARPPLWCEREDYSQVLSDVAADHRQRVRRAAAAAAVTAPFAAAFLLAYHVVSVPLCTLASLLLAMLGKWRAARKVWRQRAVGPRVLCFAPALTSLWHSFRLLTGFLRPICEYTFLSPRSRGDVAVLRLEALPAPGRGSVRLCFVSDTHSKHGLVAVPPCDVLVHTGDALLRGAVWRSASRDVAAFAAFLARQRHCSHCVVIGGNHDAPLQRMGPERAARALGLAPGARGAWLENSGTTLPLGRDGRFLRFWGSPWSTPSCSPNRAWQQRSGEPGIAEREAALFGAVPAGVDVLLTHAGGGSAALARCVERVQPRIHAFGHVHTPGGPRVRVGATGGGTCSVNASICDDYYDPVQPPVVVDLEL